MLSHNHPATSYISWFGLVIIDTDETQYIITDGKSCKKYIYWEKENPYILKESDEWIEESTTKKMIYINDFGTGTEVPRNEDDIKLYYNDTGNGSASRLVGEALGKYDELNGKYMIIQEDVNGIKEVLGSETTEGNSIIERLNKVEKTAQGTEEKISEVERDYADDKELEELRNNINVSIINVGEALSYYEEAINEMSKDLEVSNDEKLTITSRQTTLLDSYEALSQYHKILIQRLNKTEGNNETVTNLNKSIEALRTSINNLNNNVNDAMSDNTISPTDLTTMLNMVANVGLKNNDYKNLVSDAILLGIGGRLIESVLNIKKTSNEFSQTMSNMIEEIDGETGLKVQVTQNATAIKQNADEISLSCVKFNETTAQLTVGDGVIKLDAGKVLMTGTLTWDSLDDEAKQNLKGENGTAEYVMLVGDQIFKYDKDGNPNVTSIVLNAQVSNISNPIFDWYYRNTEISNDWIHIENNTNLSSITITHDSSMWGSNNNSITIRVTCNGLSDDMTVVKLYDGVIGQDAKTVMVTGEQLFRYKNDFTGVPTPEHITLNGYKNNINSTSSRWYYRISDTDVWTEISSARGSDVLTINHDSSYFGNSRILMIRYEVETYNDIISIAKISDGSDGYFVLLTNENHSIPCDANGDYDNEGLEEAHTYIRVYKGLNEVPFTLTKVDNGCTSIYSSSTRRLDITSITNKIATVTMNITVNDNVFQKVMTISKSIRGEKGEDGNGVNVIGQLENISQLPSTGVPGDAYIIDGLLYIWSETTNGWSDGVPFRGEQGLQGKPGADGRTTYLHIKYSNDGQTFTSNNGEEPGDWLGQYTDYIETDSNTFLDYTWKKIKGEDGDNGIVANLTNDTHIVPVNADGTFSADSFVGCETKISLSYIGIEITNGVTYNYTASTGIVGNFNATNGTYTVTGWTGNGTSAYVDLRAIYNGVTYTKRFDITKSKSPYDAYTIVLTNESHTFAGDVNNAINGSTTCDILAYKGSQLTNLFVGTITNIPTGMTVSITNNNSTNVRLNISVDTNMTIGYGVLDIPIMIGELSFTKTFSYAISFRGTQGIQGLPGVPGKDGKDGNSVKVLGRYDTLDQLNQAHPSGNENGDGYIINKDLWIWTNTEFINVGQFQGEDGSSAYVHIKYSNDGNTFTTNDGEEIGSWIGMYTDSIKADSMNFSDYKWSKYQGEDAKLLSLSANRQAIVFNSDNTPKETTDIILTTNQQNIIGTLTWTSTPSITLNGSGNTRSLSVNNFINNERISITVSSGELSDTITLVKVMDGIDGTPAYNIILSNESHTFIGEETNAIAGSTNCDIMAYRGSQQVACSIGEISGIPSGMTISVVNNNTVNATLNISVTTAMTSKNGTINIPVTVDGNSFTKVFTYSLALKGTDGASARFLSLSANRQVVSYNNDGTIKDNSAIVLTANQQNFIDALTWTTTPNVTLSGSGNNRTLAVSNFNNNNQIIVTVSAGGLSDSISIIKVSDGQRGADGTSVKILDSYDTLDQLNQAHPSGNENGDGYMVGKDLWIWNGTTFINAGQIRGDDGKDGINGINGANAYVHIKYSNDGGKTFTSNSGETPGDYMGVYTDNIQADSTNPSDYNWSLTKGNDGWDAYTVVLSNESHTFAGGTSSAIASSTTCNVIAYKGGTQVACSIGSITGTPTGMSTTILNNNSTNAYFTVSVTTSMTSRNGVLTVPITIDGVSFTKRFTYSLSLRGANGSDAKLLSLSANRQTIAYNNDNTAKDTSDITLTALQQNYSDSITWSTSPSVTLNGTGNSRTLAVSNFNNNTKISITISSGGLTDTVTLVKVTDGNNGIPAYNIILSNESHTFVGSSSGAIAGSTSSRVMAYRGSQQVACSIGTINNLPTGMSISISNNNTVNATLNISVTTAMTSKNGTINIPVTVDGNSFTKVFTYSLSLRGSNGADGSDAKLLSLSANRQAIAFNNNNTAKDTSAVTLTANQQNYSDSITWSTNPSVTLSGSGNSRTLAVSNFNNNTTIKVTISSGGLTDTVTLVKVIDGNNGEPAYNIILSNESHTFSGGRTNAIAGSTTCRVIAYRGSQQVACSIGEISNIPTGMSISISNNNTVNATLNISVTTSMSTRNGTVSIPVTIDGYTFTKIFTYALALMGDTGLNAKLLSLSASKQAIAFNNDNTAKDTSAVTLTANQQNYSDSITWSTSPSVTLNGTGNSRTLAVSNFTNNNIIKVTISSGGLSDTVTLVKVIDGADGSDGIDGEDGYVINISNDNHTFVADSTGNITTQQSTTTVVTAFRGTTPVTPTIGTLPTINGLTLSRSGTTITITAPVGSNMATHGTFNIPITINGNSFNKSFSYSKVNCGENGEDGYTIILTNEAHIFPCANNGNIKTAITTTTVVRAFKDTTEITPTIGTLPSVTGLTLSKSGTTITIRANTGTSLASSGSFNIPITVDGISFIKTFSWSKSFAGADGSFDGTLPEWITEWDNGKTTINGTSVVTPRLFAGTVSNGVPTGVALGKNVFGTSGTYANVNGMVGYKGGKKIYEFNSNGNIIWGNTSGKYLSWDGTNLEINASTINLGSSTVATENGVIDKINGIKIGGTNLVSNSAPKSTSGWSPSTGWATSLVDCSTAPYGKAIRITNNSATSGAVHKPPIDHTKCVNGEYYTISAWIRASKSCRVSFMNEMMTTRNGVNVTTSWKYYTFTSKIDTGATYHSNVFYVTTETCNAGMWLEIHSLKLEKGTKASYWSPAPEDIDSSINAVDGKFANYSTTSQMNSAINQKANEITSTVSKTYATKSALNTVDGKFANYSTTSAMNSAINQKANEITSTVSNTYTTKTDFNNLKIGGTNLLKNSTFNYDFSKWSPSTTYTNAIAILSEGVDGGKCVRINGVLNGSYLVTQNVFNIKKNTEYILSGYYKTSNVVKGSTNPYIHVAGAYYQDTTWKQDIVFTPLLTGTTDGWVKFSTPIKTRSSNDWNCMKIILYVRDCTGTLWFDHFKLEEGNKATDWSASPSDTAIAINNVNLGGRNLFLGTKAFTGTAWNGNSTYNYTDSTTGYVYRKIWASTSSSWVKYILQYVNVEANTDYIMSALVRKNTDANVDIAWRFDKSYVVNRVATVTSKEWTRITFPVSKLTANSSSEPIVLFVPQNSTCISESTAIDIAFIKFEKANKATDWTPAPEDIDASINAVDNKFANYSTTTQMNSAINQKANEITSSVSSTYTTKADFNGLTIGGTNLVTNSCFAGGSTTGWGTNQSSTCSVTVINETSSPTGKALKLAVTSTASGRGVYNFVTPKSIGEYTLSFYGKSDTAGYKIYMTWEQCKSKDIELTTSWQKYTLTMNKTNLNRNAIGVYTKANSANGNFYVHSFKLEKGNKATSWSPAPEDVNASITAVDNKFANYSTTAQMNSAITQKSDSILSTVNSTYATKSALNTVDGKFVNYSTTSQMNSAISQKANEITSTVSSTYVTKTTFDGLTIGGRNLALQTNQGKLNWDWSMQAGTRTVESITEDGINCVKLTKTAGTAQSGWSVIIYDKLNYLFKPATEYVVSFEVKSNRSCNLNVRLMNRDSNNNLGTNAMISKAVTNDGKWCKIISKITSHSPLPTIGNQVVYITGMNNTDNSYYIIRNLMVEEGNKATSWSPAPEDINASIEDIDGYTIILSKDTIVTRLDTDGNMLK